MADAREEFLYGYLSLFRGRDDVYGTEDGGCLRNVEHSAFYMIQWHLNGMSAPIGIYPIREDNTVWWGCIDWDQGRDEAFRHAKATQLALEAVGITSWAERSRSKGYHLWVFLTEPMPAKVVRRALRAACQIADTSDKEVNPKQDSLAPGQVGNYVRLPYPGLLGDDTAVVDTQAARRVMVSLGNEGDGMLDPMSWLWAALDRRTHPSAITDLARLFNDPTPKRVYTPPPPSALRGGPVDRLFGAARDVYERGPKPDQDRSAALFSLANLLVKDGRHTPAEMLALMLDADNRWGKFAGRSDQELRLQQMLDKAGR